MVQAAVEPGLIGEYEDRFAGSQRMHQRSAKALAGGIAHDGRHIKPFPLYVDHAQGAYKWDVDGNRLIDYAMGHGSLILGHNHPEVMAAVHEAADKGTHFGSGHEAEIKWAEKVTELIPSADLVRFTASGTEATLLAMRLARAYSGKPTILKFEGHFHGWNDYLIKGEKPPFENPGNPGVPDEVGRTVAVLPSDDLGMVEERLSQSDIAAIIIEPSGGSWSSIPLEVDFLQNLRDLATKTNTILIFDEVITGFRWSPGGAQRRFDVIPDMTTMAKILAGGFPGGAVGGRADIMEGLIFKDAAWNSTRKVIHPGTYNGNPVAATAGYTCLGICANPEIQIYCDDLAARLRTGINTVLENRNIDGCSWGESSVWHVMLGQKVKNRTAGDMRAPEGIPSDVLKASGGSPLVNSLAIAMALEGVDLFHGGGLLSIAHTKDDIDFTVEAFDKSLTRLEADGQL
ncbi:MAG TPA: aminotransferase class III-fold pyridoxal phosphate-dependent enzyme [Thermomicrobiales bacterium]|nr:aminotransferase class III-fold pyridoxal phosphate-dependent enzyme [Thermomicrobiales bacterium]